MDGDNVEHMKGESMSISHLSSYYGSNQQSLALQLAQSQSQSLASMLGSSNTDTGLSSMYESMLSSSSDVMSVSAISSCLNAISQKAKASGVEEYMGSVQQFALALREEGTPTVNILQHLSNIREIAATDPDRFAEIFGESKTGDTSKNTTSTTTKAITETDAE